MIFQIHHLVAIVSCLLSSLLCLLFISSTYFKSRANNYLAIAFGSVAVLAFNEFTELLPMAEAWRVFINDIMWELLFAPALLLYFAENLKHGLARSKWKAWLFAPFVLTLLINIYIDLDHEFHLTNSGIGIGTAGLNLYYEIESWLSIIYSVVVCAWTYFMLRQTSERNASNWLSRFWLWTTGVISLWVVLFLMSDMADLDFFYLLWLAISILFFWVCLRGAMQFKLAEERFEIRSIIDAQSAREKMPSEEPQKPNEDYFLQLEEMMSTNKQYRDPSLNREQVADQLGISSGYLSKLISAHTEGNFSSYVNQYRIEEVKRLLLSSEFEHYSLLAIGFEAGFNSKTTFNNTFKRLTGQTPRQFRQGAM